MTMGAGAGDSADPVEGLVDSVATSIGADYFKTIGLAVTRGREFTASEELAPDGARIAIIDETLAKRLFGKANPLDQIVQWQSGRRGASKTVRRACRRRRRAQPAPVARRRHAAARLHAVRPGLPRVHVPSRPHVRGQRGSRDGHAAGRAAGCSSALDPELPIISLETRPMFRDRNLVLWLLRAGAKIFLAFGLLALFMTVVGVYGVKSYMVARRTREIGIRVALGATSRRTSSAWSCATDC